MKKELLTDRKTNSWGSVVKKDFIKHKATYALFIPVLLFYLIFHYAPLYGTIIAFKNFTPSGGIFGSPWVGMKHFLRFINLPTFGTIIGNTLKISIFSIIFAFPAPIILALLINELKSKRLAKIAQNATYLPHFISLVVVCGIVKDFTKDTGIITYILSFFGVPQVTLLMYPQYFLPIYIGSGIWQEAGWSSIVYLAALTSIDASLYEAASILPLKFIQLQHRNDAVCNVGLIAWLEEFFTETILNQSRNVVIYPHGTRSFPVLECSRTTTTVVGKIPADLCATGSQKQICFIHCSGFSQPEAVRSPFPHSASSAAR